MSKLVSILSGPVILSVFVSQAAAAAPLPEDLLSGKAKALFSTQDVRGVQAAWEKTSLGQMLDDPALKPFRAELRQRGDEANRGKLPPRGLWWEDVLEVSAGPAALAIVPDGVGSTTSLVLLDVTNREQAVQAFWQKRMAEFARFDVAPRTQNINQTSVTSYHYRVREGKGERQVARFYCVKNGLLIVAEHEATLKELLAQPAVPGADRLSSQPAFKAMPKLAGDNPAPSFRWYLDPLGLHALRVRPVLAAGEKPKPDTLDLLTQHGLSVVQAVGGTVSIGAEGHDLVLQTAIFAPGELEKAGLLLSFVPGAELTPPAWFPANVSSLTAVNWKLSDAINGYGTWFDVTEGQGDLGTFDAILEDIRLEKNSPQVDVRKEIIARLKGPVQAVTFAPSEADAAIGAEQAKTRWLYAVQTVAGEEAALVLAMRKMLQGDDDVLKPARKLGAAEVWVYRPDGGPNWLGPNLSNVAITVTKGYWVVASDFKTLESVIAPVSTPVPLAKNVAWQSVVPLVKQLPPGAGVARQFSELEYSLASTYAALRAGKIQEDTTPLGQILTLWLDQIAPRAVNEKAAAAGGAAANPSHNLNFKKLPPFAALQKYLGAFASETAITRQGWSQTGVLQGP